MFTYQTRGTCSQYIELDIEGDVIRHVAFWGGCNGNLQGISRLVTGMKVDEVINRMEGIRCGYKSTSCPDQLCQALRQYMANQSNPEETSLHP